MHLRVGVDITKPIIHKKSLNIGLEEPMWVSFTYERLSNLYFCCGVPKHSHRDCHLWPMVKVKCEQDGFSYGNWLKARTKGKGEGVVRPKQTLLAQMLNDSPICTIPENPPQSLLPTSQLNLGLERTKKRVSK